MDSNFAPDQQAKLAKVAAQMGVTPEQWLQAAALSLLDEHASFLDAIEKSRASLESGAGIEEEEMAARVERMFKR